MLIPPIEIYFSAKTSAKKMIDRLITVVPDSRNLPNAAGTFLLCLSKLKYKSGCVFCSLTLAVDWISSPIKTGVRGAPLNFDLVQIVPTVQTVQVVDRIKRRD